MNISLLSLDLGAVLLNVLAIIGIIIAGGFLIFFLGDLLLSILDPKNNAIKDDNKYQVQERLQEPVKPQELTYMEKPVRQQTPTQTQNYEPYKETEKQTFYQEPSNQYQEVDFEKALEEERMLFADVEPSKTPERKVERKVEEKPTSIAETEDIFQALKMEEQAYKENKINQEAASPFFMSKTETKKEVEEEEEDFDFDDIFFSDDDNNDEENNKEDDFDFNLDFGDELESDEEVETDEKVAKDDNVEEFDIIDEENDEDEESFVGIENNQDVTNLKNENETLKKEIEKLLEEQVKRKKEVEEERKNLLAAKQLKQATSTPLLSLEEYEVRLTELRDRLKYNEKELRAIKREYIPLRKVRTTLEKDKKKLRRREALVAKQKILFYGVNNMADIDAEKAKKLEEDLDLLDGLRLSVQHCEEVIKNSEERYPILETSFNILTKTIGQIKSDIEMVENNIAKLSKKA